jgi:peptidoglycan/LPS O-acetylase OafA/YrhL
VRAPALQDVGASTAAQPRAAAPPYRPDIDGLRALAVLSVILFHAGIPGLGGGYAGVDVFFVISGYLITRLLEQSREDPPRHSLARFYLRRARRILPALLAACAATAIAGVVLLVPDDLVNLGKFLTATPLFLSNIASWTNGGYFAPVTGNPPLGHLWSIAVEEQFYLVYPLLLLVITRYLPRHRRATLFALGLASLLLCIWASHSHPVANYFLAPARAWELLLGASLALGAPRIGHRGVREYLALASLLGIAIAVHAYSARTLYPGTAAILPCVATGALILTGDGSRPALVNRVLGWRPLVFVGLISYSLYLWHRPLFVLVTYYHIEPLGPATMVVLLGVLGLLAAASWRFIEQPIRKRALLRAPRALLGCAAAGSGVILLAGAVLWSSQGFPQRFAPELRALLPESPAQTPELVRCMRRSAEQIRSGQLCSYGSRDSSAPRVLVWGDSHTLVLMPAYQALARSHHARLYFVAKSFCPPLLAPESAPAGAAVGACSTFNAAVVEAITRLDPQVVILGGRWVDAEIPPGVADIAAGIEETVGRVGDRSRSVCVVLGVPALKYWAPYALLMARRRHIPDEFLSPTRAEVLAQYGNMERELRARERQGSLILADPKEVLCRTDSCLYKAGGRSLYGDDNHLSEDGALFVTPALERCFEPARRQPAGASALAR